MKVTYLVTAIVIFVSLGTVSSGQGLQKINLGLEHFYGTKLMQTTTDFKVVRQPMSEQDVLRIHMNSSSKPHIEYVYKDITLSEKGSYELEFHLKIMSPRGVVQVEVSRFDSDINQYIVVAKTDISNKQRYIPCNWIRYQLSIPPPAKKYSDICRIAFYFNRDTVESDKPVSLLNGQSDYFLSGVQQVGFHFWNGRMDQWDITNWPAKPKSWFIKDGEGSLERGRGHLLDDESILMVGKEGGVLQVMSEQRFNTSVKRKFAFYARADNEGKKVKVTFERSKKVYIFSLRKKWKHYMFTVDPMIQDRPIFNLEGDGRIYIDELMLL